MSLERELLGKWLGAWNASWELARQTELLLGTESPQPTPGGEYIAGHEPWSVILDVPRAMMKLVRMEVEIFPVDVRNLHTLGGIWIDNFNDSVWLQRSANGKLFLEENGGGSTPKKERPTFFLREEWYRHTLEINSTRAFATLGQVTVSFPMPMPVCDGKIGFGIGSPEIGLHSDNFGWKYKNGVFKWETEGGQTGLHRPWTV